ncbi:hypothetical protein T492DRAFT_862591, partial [Pavlovales sp. CCMP2436]
MEPEQISGLLARAAAAHGRALAVVDGQTRLTWRELERLVDRIADALAPHIAPGGTLALCSANSGVALAYKFAAAALGAIFVPLNF